MKTINLCTLGILLVCFTCWANAQDIDRPQTFQRGTTYIRYHLTPEALLEKAVDPPDRQQNNTNALTVDQRYIGAIDAYFELVPAVQHEQRTTPQLYEVKWDPCQLLETPYTLLTETIAPPSPDVRPASWRIGNLALSLDYDRTDTYNMIPSYLLRDTQMLRGTMVAPLGDSGFSLGARLAMYAEHEHEHEQKNRSTSSSSAKRISTLVMLPADTSSSLQTGFATSSGGIDKQTALLMSEQTGTHHNTVLGAVNVSGAVSGVNLFTEVGFASGSDEPLVLSSTEGANFYAHGGANYRIGQVTLGLEAGFENGDYSMDALAEDSLGFEDDFLIDDLLDLQTVGDKDKVYATVSASMSPTERMTVEGTFRYIKPLDEWFSSTTHGMEVNGAFQYSLTNYLKYLVKAGVASSNDSRKDNQYKIINSLEVSF